MNSTCGNTLRDLYEHRKALRYLGRSTFVSRSVKNRAICLYQTLYELLVQVVARSTCEAPRVTERDMVLDSIWRIRSRVTP